MAINEWWAGDPTERFWLEITDRDTLGEDLLAPKTDQSGNATWSYALISHIGEGDIVFHYRNEPGEDKAIVGYSQVTGTLESTSLRWQAHGTVGRAAGRATTRAAWRLPLANYADLANPVSLDDLRAIEPRLRRASEALASSVSGPLYLPFAFSDKRPLRGAQGYLAKFPASFVEAIPELDQALRLPTPRKAGESPAPKRASRTTGSGYQSDPKVRKALERHSVDWVLKYFEDNDYLVEDVGATNPYDILAINEDAELHIEVKGSSGTATTVELTAGEVNESMSDREAFGVLVVIDQIEWTRLASGAIATSGGRVRWWWEWEPEQERLSPTSFRYLLPPPTEETQWL